MLKKKVIIYLRVSTDEQAEKGYSIDSQYQRILDYCKFMGWEVIEIFKEDYTAKKDFNRPAYNQLKNFLKSIHNKVDYILFTQWSRFSRNTMQALIEIDRLKHLGILAHAVEQPVNLHVPEDRFLLHFYLTAPEVEVERLSLRVKASVIQGRSEGRYMGKAPFGYYNDTVSKLIFPHPINSLIVISCFKKYSQGIYSAEEIRKEAEQKGLKLKKQAFLNMLQNQAYIGNVRLPEHGTKKITMIKGLQEPLITKSLFDEVQYILKGKKKPYKRNNNLDSIPLVGHLVCPLCGKILTGSKSKGNGGYYYYYHCQRIYGCKTNLNANLLNSKFVDFLKGFQPSKEMIKLYDQVLEDVFNSQKTDFDSQKKELEAKIVKLESRLNFLDEKWMTEKLNDDQFQIMKEKEEQAMMKVNLQLRALKETPKEYSKYLKFGLSFLSDASNYYLQADATIKRRILGSIFPEKLIFENGHYRTTKINTVIDFIFNNSKALIKKRADKNVSSSTWAPESGLEPETL